MSTAAEVAVALGGQRSGSGWLAHCPSHNDQTSSLSIGEGRDGRVLLNCHAGCPQQRVIAAVETMGLTLDGQPGRRRDPRPDRKPNRHQVWNAKHANDAPNDSETPPDSEPPTPARCNTQAYARLLKIPVEFLRDAGLTDTRNRYGHCIRIPDVDDAGLEVAARLRTKLTGKDRFRWSKGDKPCLFGLGRIADARKTGSLTLVEGESDCLTLWFEGFSAVGVPGASMWRDQRDARHFDGFATIYVVIEPDDGGKAVLRWLAESSIRERTKLVWMPDDTKDPAALYQRNPGEFAAAWERLLQDAQSWPDYAEAANLEVRAAAKATAARLLSNDNILREVVHICRALGVVREVVLIQLAYLSVTTRLFDGIVSIIVKGPSSAGKSFVIKQVLRLFPEDAYSAWTSVSEHALIYSNDSLSHKMMVFYEAAGISDGFLAYIIRSLLSEGRLVYQTVEKIGGKQQARTIIKDGPTGLILTTTQLSIDSETETRCLSIPATDTPQQTAAIMKQQAAMVNQTAPKYDLSEWHALQTYLALERTDVVIPYAAALSELIPPVAIRLRRDFPTLLNLIKAHALLHQHHRDRDKDGAIIADLTDYTGVSRLINGLISDAAGITVPPIVRETRNAVAELLAGCGDDEPSRRPVSVKDSVSIREISKALKLDHSTTWRRVQDALARGYLKNLEEKPRRPARIRLGHAIDKDERLLPTRAELEQTMRITSQ